MYKTIILAAVSLLITLSTYAQKPNNEVGMNEKSIYDFKVKSIDGNEIKMEDYKGKVLLIVNVASQCGFTPQYEGLERLCQKYKEQGFVVLGFPCNQFAGQEPGTDAEIKNFCSTKYNVTFPMFSKIEVNGDNTNPLYVYLKQKAPGVLSTKDIKWNFTKFLIDKNGNVVERFAPATTPDAIDEHIAKLLKK
jgi:glutathione peroxidase